MSELKRTPLFEVYEKHGAKLVDFGGWELPVQFSGIKEEHLAVRNNAGIFDVSHMGEIRVSGKGAVDFLQYATTNDVERLSSGGAQYSAILNEKGGFIDDIFVYRLEDEDFLICVNAANTDKDFEWLSGIDHPDCELINQSAKWAQIAVQGPRAVGIVSRAAEQDMSPITRLQIGPATIGGIEVLAARTGYTGEDGFEIFAPEDEAVNVWEAIMKSGENVCVPTPVGLGARDTLRLEMGYPLHGSDIDEETTPLEADLGWIVASYKADFIGKSALDKQKKDGLKRKRAGFVMEEQGIPRGHYKIYSSNGQGEVTSGTKTPSLDSPIAMGYIPPEDAKEGNEVKIEIRGKQKKARVERWPFYKAVKKPQVVCAE